jgi:hypothetical protein
VQRPRRKDGQMGAEMREFRMQLAPEVFDELAGGAFHVGYQRITQSLHT